MIYTGTKDGETYGFYLENTGLSNVFELTDAEHMALMDGQSAGKVITFHEDEKPTLEDPPDPTEEELAEQARAKRDALIADIEWRLRRYENQVAAGIKTTDTAEKYAEILAYVQDLRDVPEQEGFPTEITWEDVPE